MPDGFTFTLHGKAISFIEVAEWLSMKRLCCPFVTFHLSSPSKQGHWLLALTGPAGVKALIEQDFPRALSEPGSKRLAPLFAARYHYHTSVNVRSIRMSAPVKTKPRPEPAAAEQLCNIPCFKEDLVRKLQKKLPSEEALEDMRATFAALADVSRLKILYALKDAEELCVCDVAHVIGLSVSTASHHLRKLRDLKLLKYRNDGKMAYYSIRSEFAAQLVSDTLQEVSD